MKDFQTATTIDVFHEAKNRVDAPDSQVFKVRQIRWWKLRSTKGRCASKSGLSCKSEEATLNRRRLSGEKLLEKDGSQSHYRALSSVVLYLLPY